MALNRVSHRLIRPAGEDQTRRTPSSDGPAVEVADLVKRYRKSGSKAVDGVDFTVRPGEIFGMLGPNGAGKSTTVGILTTRVRKTSGTARVAGVDVHRDPVTARSRLSVVPQTPNLDSALDARRNLLFHAAYHGVPAEERRRRADSLLEVFGLAEHADGDVLEFSGGMRQRLLIARALIHQPEVMFLDEPSTGLDPQARLFVWDRVRELREGGVTVVLTTHDMDEAAALADRVGIIDHGRVLALDTPATLTRSLPGSTTLDLAVEPAAGDDADAVVDALETVDDVERTEVVSESAESSDGLARLRLYLTGEAAPLVGPLTQILHRRDARLSSINLGQPSLEDVFIHLTGRELR